MKRRVDLRYYACLTRHCFGQISPVLRDELKRPVFLCSQCGKQFSKTAVDQAYRLLLMRE